MKEFFLIKSRNKRRNREKKEKLVENILSVCCEVLYYIQCFSDILQVYMYMLTLVQIEKKTQNKKKSPCMVRKSLGSP